MEISAIVKYQVQGNPQPLDKTINEAYIGSLKKHIELLEDKKRMFENEFMYGQTTDMVKGIIIGLNYAIEQLKENVDYLKNK